ncbi:DoxX family protein [Pedobacter sp. AW31-3R]|uniref:DoxX family protein n=1 Tax=Pedobacter sp. AW31-3R TaxID=3445781 RepID=UPI003FA15F34
METFNHYSKTQNIFRILLGCLLLFTGIGHLSFVRTDFLAQVPEWVPIEDGLVVLLSGIAEISIGLSLIFLKRYRVAVGWVAAIFFVAIFPGNYAQYTNKVDAFGLNSDGLRLTRLFLHPLLVIWPLWSCGSWSGVFGKKGTSQ